MSIRSSYELTRLFLALSDVTRQQLLNQLSEPESVIDVCSAYDILVHEATRHLRRLEDVGLIYQLSNGEYTLSQYGRTIIPLVDGMSNVHDLLEYWEGHTTTELPVHLRCLPGQLNDLFLRDTALYTATQEAIDTSIDFLWVLNYPVDRSHKHVADLRVLASGEAEANKDARTVQDISSALVINERRAFIFFPGIKNDKSFTDLSNGFMIRETNPTYWLAVEFFSFLWGARAAP